MLLVAYIQCILTSITTPQALQQLSQCWVVEYPSGLRWLNTQTIDDELLITRPNTLLVHDPSPSYSGFGALSIFKVFQFFFIFSLSPEVVVALWHICEARSLNAWTNLIESFI